MSLFETKTADNFIYDEAHDPREHLSAETPFLRKNVSYVVDQQAGNGSYTNGEVIIDSQAIAASGNVIDWRNGYIAVPFNTKCEVLWPQQSGAITNPSLAKFALAMKNNSLLDSLKVEANGKTIITATSGLANLVNFKMLSTMTPASLAKDGAVIGFSPDTQGQVGNGAATGLYKTYNAANDSLSTATTGDALLQTNTGLVERQNNWIPTQNATFMSEANQREEGTASDVAGTINTTSAAYQAISDIHFVAVIRLRDLHDYFDKHSISRGISYRFTLKFNQCVSVLTYTAATTNFTTVTPTLTTTQTSGSTQPAMFCAGSSSLLSKMTWATTQTGDLLARITSQIDTDATNARFSGVRLYVPSLELDPTHQESLLSSSPIVKKSFFDFMTQTTQTFASSGAAINVQVSTSCTNPRALIVIPRWSQSSGTVSPNIGQGIYSDISPFSTVPGSTDPLLSLTNLQIKMGSNYVLPDRLFYSFQTFQDHISSIFAQNGNQVSAATSGLISKKSFETVHRYYAFDLSRYPDAMSNLPQMISLECKNNSAVAVELQCILLYSRDVEFNLAAGSMTITA